MNICMGRVSMMACSLPPTHGAARIVILRALGVCQCMCIAMTQGFFGGAVCVGIDKRAGSCIYGVGLLIPLVLVCPPPGHFWFSRFCPLLINFLKETLYVYFMQLMKSCYFIANLALIPRILHRSSEIWGL